MNQLDFFLLAIAAMAALGGYRLGFLTRTVSWVGMGLGFVVAARFLPAVLEAAEGASSGSLLAIAGVCLMIGAFVGQAIGLLIGSRISFRLPSAEWRTADHIMGAVAGLVGVALTLWVLLPTMSNSPGLIAEQTRGSTFARAIHQTMPEPPDAMVALRRIVGEDQFPEVFSALRPAPDLGPPPSTPTLTDEVAARVATSTVKITGVACDRVQEGSGFVTVGSDVVVTNAHVVAGHEFTQVETNDGQTHDARVVAFDPDRDLAVLRVPGLDRAPLPIADGEVGDQGGVFGHPGGAPLRVAPFVIGEETVASGSDIYDRRRAERQILILASNLAHGDSGGALIDGEGAVVGVAFAIAPDDPDVAYALDSEELIAVLEGGGALDNAVGTGACLR